MFVPETLTIQQSPQHQFQTIDQSQQQINPLETIQFGQMKKSAKIVPELKIRKIYLMKVSDNEIIRINYETSMFGQSYKQTNTDNKIQLFPMRRVRNSISQILEFCRICLCDDGNSTLIRPCNCKGSLRFIHENCLKVWILEKQGIEQVYKNDIDCEVCHTKFQMETKFLNQKQFRMLKKAPRARICCWAVEIIVTLGIIGTIIALIFQIINGSLEPILLAGTTVLCIIMILIISLVYVSCIDQVTVEVLDPWRILDVQGESESKSISIIELDNQNKQTIQTINHNEERHDMRYSTINVVKIQS
ncbi:unnamed protein product (macronuclear) [Paramecium tetraurelia]|uniref:RING-CH-type domain-containing protein n=1 Tax=Paramecium tetraurelia TaxID=5888 RepID=A0BQU1_PARTE|nr:uncharacterized protein GSPATT00031137001 [Paramecium tetraurelia]CAK60908.1 unnamed protein product [Paramecium tetraurelia]|eukprot:XP_001428306.1 hypothetical protein (macronuclear) [Paramecium tetraurelia strain d4-2]